MSNSQLLRQCLVVIIMAMGIISSTSAFVTTSISSLTSSLTSSSSSSSSSSLLIQQPTISYSFSLLSLHQFQYKHKYNNRNENPINNNYLSTTKLQLSLTDIISGDTSSSLSLSMSSLSSLSSTLLSTTSPVPLLPSFIINTSLFLILKSKLNKMLTPEGYYHSLALGTLLWHTLGWRGWTTCVLYLFLGQLVTKVKFQEKEAMGIAEGRGGRRGPENVWYVLYYFSMLYYIVLYNIHFVQSFTF